MSDDAIADLWSAYEGLLGDPSDVLELRRKEGGRIEGDELDILIYQPSDLSYDPFTYLATAGMSLRAPREGVELVEIVVRVDGAFEHEQIRELAHALAVLAVVPLREGVTWNAGTILENVRLPIFSGMSCAVLLDWFTSSARYLECPSSRFRVLYLMPFYAEEIDSLREIGPSQFVRNAMEGGENLYDPSRGRVAVRRRRPSRSEHALDSSVAPGVDVSGVWSDIEEQVPKLMRNFRKPAVEEQLAEAEAEFGARIPADLRLSLLRYDGGVEFDSYECLEVGRLISVWRSLVQKSAEGAFDDVEVVYARPDVFRPVWWDSGWMPFAMDSAGNLLCVDTVPGPRGKVGQVLRWEVVEGPSTTKFRSFGEWLNVQRDDIVKGALVFGDAGVFVRKSESSG